MSGASDGITRRGLLAGIAGGAAVAALAPRLAGAVGEGRASSGSSRIACGPETRATLGSWSRWSTRA